MNRRKIGILFMAALMMVTVFCSLPTMAAKEQKKAVLRMSWWGGDARHKAILASVKQFMKENPNIEIETEYSALAQYKDKFMTQLYSGSTADIVAIDQPWVADIVARGDFFLDLSKYSRYINIGSFDSFLVNNYCKVNGKPYFVPAGINGMGSLVDAEALAKFGFDPKVKQFTWDDMIALGEKVHSANPNNYLCVIESKQAGLYFARVYLRQLTGKQLINDDGSMGCTRDQLAQSLGLIDTLYKKSIFQPISEHSVFNGSMLQNPKWINGQMFMVLGRTSVMTDPSARLPKNGKPRTTNFLMPKLKNAKESGIEVRPAAMFAISKNTKSPEAAVKFLNYLFTDKESVITLKDNYSVPARKASRTITADILDPAAVANANYSLANPGSTLNGYSSSPEVESLFTEVMEKIAFGQYKNMNQAADEVISRIKDIVAYSKQKK